MPTTDSRRSGPPSLVDRYPAATYFALTLALSWGYWFPVMSVDHGFPTIVAVVPGAFGPMAAAAIVTKLRGESVREWFGASLHWRRSIRWYALAVAVPVAISAALLVVLVVTTGTFETARASEAGLLLGVNVVFASLLGGGQEEFGWRGFALPHLQERFDALTASLLVGAVWALWHAPMFVFDVYAERPALYAAGVLAYAVVFTWYYNSSQGFLPGAVLLHGTINASVNVPPMLVGGLDAVPVPYEGVLAVAFWVVALALIARHGRETLAAGSKVVPTWSRPDDARDDAGDATGASPEVSD